jgi:hypothetical protein
MGQGQGWGSRRKPCTRDAEGNHAAERMEPSLTDSGIVTQLEVTLDASALEEGRDRTACRRRQCSEGARFLISNRTGAQASQEADGNGCMCLGYSCKCCHYEVAWSRLDSVFRVQGGHCGS